jgi:hypothetical protein
MASEGEETQTDYHSVEVAVLYVGREVDREAGDKLEDRDSHVDPFEPVFVL